MHNTSSTSPRVALTSTNLYIVRQYTGKQREDNSRHIFHSKSEWSYTQLQLMCILKTIQRYSSNLQPFLRICRMCNLSDKLFHHYFPGPAVPPARGRRSATGRSPSSVCWAAVTRCQGDEASGGSWSGRWSHDQTGTPGSGISSAITNTVKHTYNESQGSIRNSSM